MASQERGVLKPSDAAAGGIEAARASHVVPPYDRFTAYLSDCEY
jgi:hypothetical protein